MVRAWSIPPGAPPGTEEIQQCPQVKERLWYARDRFMNVTQMPLAWSEAENTGRGMQCWASTQHEEPHVPYCCLSTMLLKRTRGMRMQKSRTAAVLLWLLGQIKVELYICRSEEIEDSPIDGNSLTFISLHFRSICCNWEASLTFLCVYYFHIYILHTLL